MANWHGEYAHMPDPTPGDIPRVPHYVKDQWEYPRGTPRKIGTCLPYFDLMKKFDVQFMSVVPGTVVLNIIYEGL